MAKSNPREYRVQGPPGTGKTTYLKRQIEAAATQYTPSKVVVCSLTRTAAAVVAGSSSAIPKQNIGTIHSFAYRSLPGVNIAESQTELFNAFCAEAKQPMMKLSGVTKKVTPDNEDIVETPSFGSTPGDELLGSMNRFRARMIRREVWPEQIRAFDSLWSRWKREAGFLDFTDLLEISLRDVAECPGSPAAFFADESQDFSRLAFTLARKWGERALRFVHVGDPDQILYAWAGVDPTAFYNDDLPEEQRRTLPQSFRVPRTAHALAKNWIDATPGRKPVVYRPRDVEGEVRRTAATMNNTERLIEDASKQIDAGRSVMFLTSCAYMLNPTIAGLKNAGIPYHNPYRATRGDWNPIRVGATSPTSRLAAFFKRSGAKRGIDWEDWTNEDVRLWTELLPTKDYFIRGARTTIEERAKEEPQTLANIIDVCNYFQMPHWDAVSDANEKWFAEAIDPKHRDKIAFPAKLLERGGYDALTQPPKAIVSTIHGAKGGEADVVYVFPDLSPNAYQEWQAGGEGREGVRRAFYVALTRTLDTMVLCAPASNMALRL